MNKFTQFFHKNSPLLLTIVSVLGVAGTGVLSARGGIKAAKLLDEEKPFKEELKATWKCYIPAGVVGGVTIASIVGSHCLNAKQIASLTAACGYLTYNRDRIKDKAKELLGEEQYEKMQKELYQELSADARVALEDGVLSVEATGHGDLLCLDGYSGRWFRSSREAVERAFDELNDRFQAGYGEYLCLNDYYKCLGIAETHFGWQYGWPANVDFYDTPLQFELTYIEQWEQWIDPSKGGIREPVLVIDLYSYPTECWQEM